MRTMVNHRAHLRGPILALGVASFVACLGACQTLPLEGGQYWDGRSDSGLGPGVAGVGGSSSINPTGVGGDTGAGGSADVAGTAGTYASGGTTGAGNGSGAGGVLGTGGTADRGGATGTGGAGGSAGGGGLTDVGGRGGAVGSGGVAGTTGRGGAGGAAGSGGATGPLTGMLMVSVTTKAAGGRYQPDNVGAIWIADANTRFVKSLYVWGQQRRKELRQWVSATSGAGLANNLVDAVTAATMRSHGPRMAAWNGTDTNRALVPDGSYKICFELQDGASQYQCVDFMKSRSPQTLMPANTTSFTSRTIGYTP